ncbi:MAG TPA: hypothetical protein VN179_06815 [Solirubrobacterales bacterium]|nr:hypothetical protein [Solirubrobacterales bacterium]
MSPEETPNTPAKVPHTPEPAPSTDIDPGGAEEQAPSTEGQTVPPGEETVPSGGLVQEDEQTRGDQQEQGEDDQGIADKVKEAAPEAAGAAAQQAQSLAREKPVPIALAGAFIAGVVVGRIASRR